MGKEELIQYFEDAIALETEIVTQENLVSQFEAMSGNNPKRSKKSGIV